MSDIISKIFKNKKPNFEKAVLYGFVEKGGVYGYKKSLNEVNFYMTVSISKDGDVSAEVIDAELNEPYTLHLADGAGGSFVGSIKCQYEALLNDVSAKCFDANVFKSGLAKRILEFVREEYGDELEFLWQKFDDNAVLRRSDNRKWYAVFMILPKRKLGIDSDEIAEIIDLRIDPQELQSLIGRGKYYGGWHMNKKKWCTVVLDGSISYEEICQRIRNSYVLAAQK